MRQAVEMQVRRGPQTQPDQDAGPVPCDPSEASLFPGSSLFSANSPHVSKTAVGISGHRHTLQGSKEERTSLFPATEQNILGFTLIGSV